jgi:hypothetical protein
MTMDEVTFGKMLLTDIVRPTKPRFAQIPNQRGIADAS